MQTKDQSFFSNKELSVLFDLEIFPIKRMATEKLFEIFGKTIESIKDTAIHKNFTFPDGTDCTTGKITKGENYLGYPYVVLDFPKLFLKDSVFCFRTLFWFGHYFTCSLIIGGKVLDLYEENFLKNRMQLHHQNILFALDKNPWSHQAEEPNQILIEKLSDHDLKTHIHVTGYLKFSHKFIETEPESFSKICTDNYEKILRILL